VEQTRSITNALYTPGAIGNATKRTGDNGQGLEPDEGKLSCPVLRGLEGGNTFRLPGGSPRAFGQIDMVANTGTYVDAPFHRYAGGRDVATLPLASLANLAGLVVHAPPHVRALGAELFDAHELAGKAVLIHTGWDKHWRMDQYFAGHPFLTRQAAEHLQVAGVTLVDIDSYNTDDTLDGCRPVRSILLRADIPIVEHLCHLEVLPDSSFAFYAVPFKIKGFGTFPVRAFSVVHA